METSLAIANPVNFHLSRLDPAVVLQQNLPTNTALIYVTAVEQFNQFLDLHRQIITAASIQAFLLNPEWSGSTRNLKRAALKFAIDNHPDYRNNYILRAAINEVFSSVQRVKIQPGVAADSYLTADQVAQVQFFSCPRLSLIIEFLFKTGLRISELINIRLCDCKLNGKVKVTVIGKGNKERFVFVAADLVQRIQTAFLGTIYLFETRNHSLFNRKNLLRDIKKAGKRAGFDIHPHTFRHSCAMHLKFRGATIQQVQKWLGHSTSQITIDTYFHDQIDPAMADLF